MRHAVLIVDDDEQIRTLCRTVLEERGCIVMEASNGQQALAVIKKAPIDLIVLDLSMPEMDGFEFLNAVRAESPTFKIIAMSGFLNATMLPAARMLGAAATIAKPFSLDSLLSVVRRVLAEGCSITASGQSLSMVVASPRTNSPLAQSAPTLVIPK